MVGKLGSERSTEKLGRKKRRWKLRQQILVPFLALIVLSGLIIAFFSYEFSTRLTEKELTSSMQERMASVNNSFEVFFQNAQNTVNRYANKTETQDYQKNKDLMLHEFGDEAKSNKDIMNIYLGDQAKGQM